MASSNVHNTSRLKYTLRTNNNKFLTKSKSKTIKNIKNKYDDNYLYDLIKTMEINLKMILDVIKVIEINQQNANLISKRIKIITKLFEKYQSMRKEMKSIKSKNLLNNQIQSEIKRRMKENAKFYDDKIIDVQTVINKKLLYLKKSQKKFNEIQIYIRRESQESFKFRKIFANFQITPFILENEGFVRYKNKLNEGNENKKNIITILNKEIKEINIRNKKIIKEKDNNNKIKDKENNNNDNAIIAKESASEKLNNFLICREEEIKYYELLNTNLINKKIVYERKIIISRNKFFNEVDKLKKEINININTEFSQDMCNNNDVSIIKKNNNDENLESNLNNTYYELFSIESMAKHKNDSSFLNEDIINSNV